MIDLEATLFDLGGHLDVPAGTGLEEVVRRRISTPASLSARPRRRARALLAVAAVIIVMAVAVLAISPARHAVADWLGIGAVEVRHSEPLVPPASGTGTVPGAPGTGTTVGTPLARQQLEAARSKVHFAITIPPAGSAGPLAGVEVETPVADGLVVLRYPRFTIVEVASHGGSGPILRKILGGARVENVTVVGVPGMWITGAHEIGYVDRNGTLRSDTVRRSGPVLLWERGTVTYRIEGLDRLADARAIARTLR